MIKHWNFQSFQLWAKFINKSANCVNCNEYGVKAAFYGKSKLYCSVACQNGVKKQQQQTQPNQGIKRTVEAV